jgi:hypothetical protein
VRLLRRRKKKETSESVKVENASIVHADARLADLRARVKALEDVKSVVTVRTRFKKSQ